MIWQRDKRTVEFDSTVAFGSGYDFFYLEHFWQEAQTPNDKYLIWGGKRQKWSLYRESDGMFSFEKFSTESECKEEAKRWNLEKEKDMNNDTPNDRMEALDISGPSTVGSFSFTWKVKRQVYVMYPRSKDSVDNLEKLLNDSWTIERVDAPHLPGYVSSVNENGVIVYILCKIVEK